MSTGLSGSTREGGERPITSVRRQAGTGRAPGSMLIAVAAWLLALTGGGALFVSFSAQYAYILAVRRQDAASVIEALLPDLLMTLRSFRSPEDAVIRGPVRGPSWPRKRVK